MSDRPDGLRLSQPGNEAAEQSLEGTAFGADSGPSALIDEASYTPVPLGAMRAFGDSGAFLPARTGARPGNQLRPGSKGSRLRPHDGDDLLRGLGLKAGHLTEPLDDLLVGLQELPEFAFQLSKVLLQQGHFIQLHAQHALLYRRQPARQGSFQIRLAGAKFAC